MNATIASATNAGNPAPQGVEQSSRFWPLKRLKKFRCKLAERLFLPPGRTYHTGHYDAKRWLIFTLLIIFGILMLIIWAIVGLFYPGGFDKWIYGNPEASVAIFAICVTGAAACFRTYMDLWEKTEATRTLFRTDIISLLRLLEDYLRNYHVDHLIALNFDPSLSSFLSKSGKENYFTVFDNNASLMSSLNDEAAASITDFYRHMKAGREASDFCVDRWQRLTGFLSQFGIVVYPVLPEYILSQDLDYVVTILGRAIDLGLQALDQLGEPENKQPERLKVKTERLSDRESLTNSEVRRLSHRSLTPEEVKDLKEIRKQTTEVKIMMHSRHDKYDSVQQALFENQKRWFLPFIRKPNDTWIDMWSPILKVMESKDIMEFAKIFEKVIEDNDKISIEQWNNCIEPFIGSGGVIFHNWVDMLRNFHNCVDMLRKMQSSHQEPPQNGRALEKL